MNWRLFIILATLSIAALVIYAPYEWGSEILRLEEDIVRSPEDDLLLHNRRRRTVQLRQIYPLRQRQFIFGGQTRTTADPMPVTIQRKLITEQLFLECLVVLLLASSACVLVRDNKKIKLRTTPRNFDGVPYIELVEIAVKRLNLSSRSQLEVMKKVNLVVQAHIKGDTDTYLKLQQEIDNWLSDANRINAKLPKTFLKVEAELFTEQPLKLQLENPTVGVEVVGVPLVDVSVRTT